MKMYLHFFPHLCFSLIKVNEKTYRESLHLHINGYLNSYFGSVMRCNEREEVKKKLVMCMASNTARDYVRLQMK